MGVEKMMENRLAYIEEQAKLLDIVLTGTQAEQLYRYYELLVDWNRRMNLTGITEFQEVVQKHFIDSLSLVKAAKLSSVETLIDVGTGAGFPGLPLKIVFPHLKVTLLDSLNKRIQFLDHVIEQTGLEGVQTIHGRAEDQAKPGMLRESFDLCVSRAVANLSTLCEYCIPFVKIGGAFVSYKSGEVQEELDQARSALFLLGGKLEDCLTFWLPQSEIGRSLITIGKVGGTPKKYPRKSGLPSKSPL